MDQQTRIQKIQEILKGESFGKQEIHWQDKLESKDVYKIPLKYLIYNKYNGRILSRTKSLERQNVVINPETDDGKKIIEELLWGSKIDKNKRTEASIKTFGQEKVGIITRDGIIIDGNRRAMILNRVGKYDYFKAIVLPVTLEENPIEIQKLETTYQMGTDEKLDYNPIEVYLKTSIDYKTLSGKKKYDKDDEDKTAITKLYEWIGDYKSDEGEKGIRFRLEVMNMMEDYLDDLGYNGIYTQLDGREEQFRGLTRWMNSFCNESSKCGWAYTPDDVDDLKTIAFDYIRIKFKNEEFRKIAQGQQDNHIFGNKEVWEKFKKQHFDFITSIRDNEAPINFDSEKLSKILESRDDDFLQKTEDFLTNNLKDCYLSIENFKDKKEPLKLLTKALDATSTLKTSKDYSKPEVIKKIEELNSLTESMLQSKSSLSVLKKIVSLLNSIKIRELDSSVEGASLLKEIQQIAYRIGKEI